MNDMTPVAVRLTAELAKAMLEGAGARNVSVVDKVVGRGRLMLAFFKDDRKWKAWVIRGDAWSHNFAGDVAREFSEH